MEHALCLIERNEDANALVCREVGARHVSSKKAGVGNPRIATDTGAVLAPSQITAIGNHFPEQTCPGGRKGDGCGGEGLSCSGDTELGQLNGNVSAGCVGTGWRAAAKPEFPAGGTWG